MILPGAAGAERVLVTFRALKSSTMLTLVQLALTTWSLAAPSLCDTYHPDRAGMKRVVASPQAEPPTCSI
ncbi:MAG: hypothetical protein U0793_24990 [Gemmataceae bacterium]